MESTKNNREETKYLIIENVINKYIQDSFWKDWEKIKCDDILLEAINWYVNSNWNQKKEDFHKIYEWMLNNINNKNSNNFDKNFENFMSLINNHSSKSSELLDVLKRNNKDNPNEIKYRDILDNTNNILWNETNYLLYSFLTDQKENWISLNDFINFERSFIKENENWWTNSQNNTEEKNIILSIENFNETKGWPEEIIPFAKTLIWQNVSFNIFAKKINEFLQARRLF